MAERSQFSSRLGFLLIAAGCAIGLGNVWRFPYITGQYGGAIFVLIYLAFLLGVGVPLLSVELSIGRASKRSIAYAFNLLEKPKTKWHINKYWLIPGSYTLMAFYGLITGWLLYYTFEFISGGITKGLTQELAGQKFGELLQNPLTMFVCMTTVTVVCFVIVGLGVERGLEKITKPLMILLLALLVFMSVRSVMLPGFAEGISYYLKPDFSSIEKYGLVEIIWAAMGQAFFTLSVGQGSIEIFGTYINNKHSLLSEGMWIAILDTVVALLAGFVIFPACFSYDVQPGSGPSLLFVTMSTVFANMTGGYFWGMLFFLFMLIAAMSTLIAVYESIIAICMEVFGISRPKSVLYNFIFIMLISMPALLGFNYLQDVHPFGFASFMDLEDFIVSNNTLPLGSLFMVLFITAKTGMGWKRYLAEVNTGDGLKVRDSKFFFWYFHLILPVIIAVLVTVGYIKYFG